MSLGVWFWPVASTEQTFECGREGSRVFSCKSREAGRQNARALVADRQADLPAFRVSLAPLRLTLKAQPFLGGERALYADYAYGPFQWA